jgi:hypothetical protein
MSALRLATTTQGVTQAVGLSSPDNSAVAPAGVDVMEIFSVVPRDIDAQPRHGNTIAAATSSLIIGLFPQPRWNLHAAVKRKQGEVRDHTTVVLIAHQPSLEFRVTAKRAARPSLFAPIRGIVRQTDSQRPKRAQQMKSHAETIESHS